MSKSRPNIIAKARQWATKHKLFGAQAFLRYVMFNYLDALNQVSDDFILRAARSNR